MIDEALLKRLADLSALELDAAELSELTSDLKGIVDYVAILNEADTSSLPREAPSGLSAHREDTPHRSFETAIALREAPRSEDGGFVLPAFVDEG